MTEGLRFCFIIKANLSTLFFPNFDKNMKTMNTLNTTELNRYQRHLVLPNFGMDGQLKLKNARVLVVGAGGLGCPVLQYLAAAGVGHIGIVDFDKVEESNLQRQILYSVEDIGKSKVLAAKAKLEKLNPLIKMTTFETLLNKNNVFEIFKNFDVIADGTDNFNTRYLVNDACVLMGKINVFASIFRFEGQVSVFNYLQKDGNRGVNYRDLFPEPPVAGLVPNCAEGGVLGVLPGIIGSMQANEVIKVITGIGEPLVNRIFIFDAEYFTSHILKIKKNPSIFITKLTEYEKFCTTPNIENIENIKNITIQELKQLITQNADVQLIDVRERHEYELKNIGGKLISLATILENFDKIEKNKKVVIHCQSGARSRKAIALLQQEKGFENLWNLEGGIERWTKDG
jgi:adenylyltransferase/sulfurtransferase